jgi:hypothetical protein
MFTVSGTQKIIETNNAYPELNSNGRIATVLRFTAGSTVLGRGTSQFLLRPFQFCFLLLNKNETHTSVFAESSFLNFRLAALNLGRG